MKGRRAPRVTWIGSSRRPEPRVQYGVPTKYGAVGARRTAGVSTIDRLVRPRSEIIPMAAVFAAQYVGQGKTDEAYATPSSESTPSTSSVIVSPGARKPTGASPVARAIISAPRST